MKLLYTPKLKLGTIMYSTKPMSTPKSTICTIFVQIGRYGLPGVNGLPPGGQLVATGSN